MLRCKVVVRGSQQETLNLSFVLFDIRKLNVPIILKELMFSGVYDSILPGFTVKHVTTELFE